MTQAGSAEVLVEGLRSMKRSTVELGRALRPSPPSSPLVDAAPESSGEDSGGSQADANMGEAAVSEGCAVGQQHQSEEGAGSALAVNS